MAVVPLILSGPVELKFREGLCGDKSDHQPHRHDSGSLGIFWCHADQTRRLPYAAERRRQEGVAR